VAKTSTLSTQPVGLYVIGAQVFGEDVRGVIEQLNWSHGERVCTSLFADGAGDTLPVSAGWTEVRRARVYVDSDAASIDVTSATGLTAANNASVRVTIGAGSVTHAHVVSGTITSSVATATTGTGWVDLLVEINHTAGSATADRVTFVGAQHARIDASAMPDPTG
jgi:hypothetical protein